MEIILFKIKCLLKQVNKSGWDDVGGYENVIEELKLAIEFPITHAEFFEYYFCVSF